MAANFKLSDRIFVQVYVVQYEFRAAFNNMSDRFFDWPIQGHNLQQEKQCIVLAETRITWTKISDFDHSWKKQKGRPVIAVKST